MADVTPTGCLSLSQVNLQTLVAESSTFQTWVEVETAAAAKAHLHLCEADPLSVTRPCGMIYLPDSDAMHADSIAGGQGNVYETGGTVILAFFADKTVASGIDKTERNYELTFSNPVGLIMDEIMALAGTNAYINVTNWHVQSGPHLSGRVEAHATEYFWIRIQLDWGV